MGWHFASARGTHAQISHPFAMYKATFLCSCLSLTFPSTDPSCIVLFLAHAFVSASPTITMQTTPSFFSSWSCILMPWQLDQITTWSICNLTVKKHRNGADACKNFPSLVFLFLSNFYGTRDGEVEMWTWKGSFRQINLDTKLCHLIYLNFMNVVWSNVFSGYCIVSVLNAAPIDIVHSCNVVSYIDPSLQTNSFKLFFMFPFLSLFLSTGPSHTV